MGGMVLSSKRRTLRVEYSTAENGLIFPSKLHHSTTALHVVGRCLVVTSHPKPRKVLSRRQQLVVCASPIMRRIAVSCIRKYFEFGAARYADGRKVAGERSKVHRNRFCATDFGCAATTTMFQRKYGRNPMRNL